MLKFKKGDKMTVTDCQGRYLRAMFYGVQYKKDPIHYHVRLLSGQGVREADLFIPESRFV